MLSDNNPVLSNKQDIKPGKLAELCHFPCLRRSCYAEAVTLIDPGDPGQIIDEGTPLHTKRAYVIERPSPIRHAFDSIRIRSLRHNEDSISSKGDAKILD